MTRRDPALLSPVGSHDSGLTVENPGCILNNLMHFVSRVAAGQLVELSVFGNDYNTPDGIEFANV